MPPPGSRLIDLGNPVADHPFNRSLLGWWLPLPNNSRGTRLFDLLGRYPATFDTTGVAWTARPGPPHEGIDLFTNNKFVDKGIRLAAGALGALGAGSLSNFTLAFRGIISSQTDGIRTLGDFGTGTFGNRIFWSVDSSNHLPFAFDGNNTITPSPALSTDTPVTLMLTKVSTTVTMYQNGVSVGTVTVGSSITGDTTLTRTLASYALTTTHSRLDCYAVWGRGLSASDAILWHEQVVGGHPDLLRRYTPRLWTFGGAAAGGGGDVTVALTGQALTISAGSLGPSASVPLTGQAITASTGALGVSHSQALTGQAATIAAGALATATAVALTGSALAIAAGTLAPAFSLTLTGQALTVTAGTLAPSLTVSLTGQAGTFHAGSLSASGGDSSDVTVALTGLSMSISAGSLGVSHACTLIGSALAITAGQLVASGGTPPTATTPGGVIRRPGDTSRVVRRSDPSRVIRPRSG